jgi:hypothetical protein
MGQEEIDDLMSKKHLVTELPLDMGLSASCIRM